MEISEILDQDSCYANITEINRDDVLRKFAEIASKSSSSENIPERCNFCCGWESFS